MKELYHYILHLAYLYLRAKLNVNHMSFLDQITALLPFGKKPEGTEYFLSLVINLSEVTSLLWSVSNQSVEILGQKTFPYKNEEDLVDKSLQALDQAVGHLEIEPQKVLFGVPDSWNIDDNLKESNLKTMQKILSESGLQPLAYVTNTNALSFMVQKKEGVPPTAILLGLGEYVEVTLVRGGKVAGTRTTPRSEHLFDDIEKILNQFTEVEVLPSKILLYQTKTGENLSKLKDDLMTYPWMSKLSFLHFPKIEMLEAESLVQSVLVAGASEIYPNVDFKHSFSKKPEVMSSKSKFTRVLAEKDLEKPEGEKMGFVRGDIKEKVPTIVEADLEDDNLISPIEEEIAGGIEQGVEEGRQFFKQSEKSLSKFSRYLSKLPKFKFNKLSQKIIFVPILLIILAGIYLFLFKADVTIFVEPKVLEKETIVIADPKATVVSEEKKIIPAKKIEVTVSGSDKITATGTKQIGDPAKGKVVIYNMTDSSVSVSQGAILTFNNGLKFTLDTSVKVASQSSNVTLGGNMWGKSDPVGVTAIAIGPDSNLLANTTDTKTGLSVGNYSKSDVIAMITEALSGGTSKDVTVVTGDDQKKLKAKLLDTLRQKAESELQAKATGGQKVVSDALAAIDGKYTYTKQVGDAASEFSLNATVNFTGSSYLDSDLRTIVSKLVTVDVPAGYEMNLQNAETSADVIKVDKDGTLTFNAKFKANLLPKYKTDDIKNQIKGASVAGATEKLKKLESVIGSEIKIYPSLPSPVSRLPLLPQNITVKITSK